MIGYHWSLSCDHVVLYFEVTYKYFHSGVNSQKTRLCIGVSYLYHGTRRTQRLSFTTLNSVMERITPFSELSIDSLNLSDVSKEWKEA